MNGYHSYLLVEGRQDVLFIGRLLQELGLESIREPNDVPALWLPFVDGVLRQRDEALRASGREGIPLWQVFKPACLYSDSHVIVVEDVGGNRARFGRTLGATHELINGGLLSLAGVGIIPDAEVDPAASLRSAQDALNSAGLAVPANSGQVAAGAPRTGIFVLPGNGHQGGLEQILIDCAREVYPSLSKDAESFVGGVDMDDNRYTDEDLRELRTPQGPVKARVGAIATVLKPGSTIQVSLLRDRWVCEATMALSRVDALLTFLRTLCRLN